MTHICVSNIIRIGSDNGLSPVRRQAIIWTNAWILLIWPLGTTFSEILIEIYTFSFKKMHLQMSSGKRRPFVLASLRWRHNDGDSVSNRQPHDCLHNCLFGRTSKKTSKPRVTGVCAGNSPWTGEFPAQMASNAENVYIWWRHHVNVLKGGTSHHFSSRSTTHICSLKRINKSLISHTSAPKMGNLKWCAKWNNNVERAPTCLMIMSLFTHTDHYPKSALYHEP